jgi:hypothetical protein
MIVSTVVPPIMPTGPGNAAPFPKAAVEMCLRNELTEAVRAEAAVKGHALPHAPADIVTTTFQVDSLVVVSVLCAVEPIVGFELPDNVVRTGGYGSVTDALEHLLPRIEEQWMKRRGGKS